MYKSYIKRTIDFTGALIALLILAPFLLIVCAALAVANRRAGVFFTQLRPGKDGRIFRVFKFKTMNDARDMQGKLLPDEKRLTHIGQIVRSLSIDELPQLLNILRGDMSFIGPRPLLGEYLKLYTPRQARRHEVRPGMSGWAQVHGRNAISWEQKFEYDIWYVDHLTPATDLKIFLLTLRKVFIREGISSGTSATMPRFTGNTGETHRNI